jgi:hypothetical protein
VCGGSPRRSCSIKELKRDDDLTKSHRALEGIKQIEICQGTVEIDAPSEGEATELAKRRFCKAERLCEWSLHADRIQVKAADYPS